MHDFCAYIYSLNIWSLVSSVDYAACMALPGCSVLKEAAGFVAK